MRVPGFLRAAQRIIAGVICAAVLTTCWLPETFEAEIRFTSTGAFGITYIGTLTYAPLFGQMARDQISKEDADRQNRQFLAFLRQDKAFKEVNPLGRGRFQVKFMKEGQFAGNMQSYNFVNRQGPIFRLKTFEDGRIGFYGSGQAKVYSKRFEEVGLKMEGLVRVVTDAEVLEHNATFIRAAPVPGFTQYDWRIRSLRDDPPRLTARLKVDPRTGVPSYGGLAAGVEADDGKD
jgi:hypothetical protein